MDDPETEHSKPESVGDKLKAVLRDIVGLPPGDGTPHGKGSPTDEDDEPPAGGLTADDTEGLTPHPGTGIAVE